MRFRSTGLGKTELKGDLLRLEAAGDLLILHVQTTDPVRWHIRAGLQRKDVTKALLLALNPKIFKYLFGFAKRKNLKEPENF